MQTNRMKRLGVGLAVCAAVAVSSWPIKASHAQYDFHLTVDGTTYSCDYAGLSAAIDAVNEVWNGVITLNCPGQNIYFPANGAKTIRGGFVLDGLDANSARLDVAGGVDTQFFIIEPSASVIFRNITMQHAEHNGHGGAILVKDQGQLALESSVIAWCRSTGGAAGGGGAISMEGGGWLTLRGSELFGNTAFGSYGGAIEGQSAASNIVVDNSQINQNMTDTNGGGIFTRGSLYVTASTFDGNSAPWGAAIYGQKSGPGSLTNGVIENSVFQHNRAIAELGIVGWYSYSPSEPVSLTVTHSEFSNNYSKDAIVAVDTNLVVDASVFDAGGGIHTLSINTPIPQTTIIKNSVISGALEALWLQNTFTVTNVSIMNNQRGLIAGEGYRAYSGWAWGGAGTGYVENVTIDQSVEEDIKNSCFNLKIVNSTITHPSTTLGSFGNKPVAVWDRESRCAVPHILLKNTVIDAAIGVKACWFNASPSTPNDIKAEYTRASDNTCFRKPFPKLKPLMLGPLQDNGGPRVGAPGRERPLLTRLPLPGSVLIDGGGTCSPFDERGFSRDPVSCDIGAVEVGATAP